MGTRPNRTSWLLLVVISGMLAGCTSLGLRVHTVGHSMTLEDIYTQQVMNNLALFIQNPQALPFFAYPNQGTTSIQDTGNVGNLGYTAASFVASPFILNGNRQAVENWVLVPISDPAKLALMRCAYQQALSSCIGIVYHTSDCPNCEKLRQDFYGPPRPTTGSSHYNLPSPCLDSACCWIHWGRKCDIPKNCLAPYVGACNGFYAWVTPECRDMLTRLTLTILDYAVNEPVQFEKRTKTVEMTIDPENGSVITEKDQQGIKITATIPIDLPSKTMLILDNAKAYGDYFRAGFTKEQANELWRIASNKKEWRPYLTSPRPVRMKRWRDIWNDELPAWGELKDVVQFVRDHGILPEEVPTEAELNEIIHGPAVYQRKYSASAGLQQLGQRLNAASPSAPPAGGR